MDPLNTNNPENQGQPNIPSAGNQPGDLQISPDGQITSPQIVSPSVQSSVPAPSTQNPVTPPNFLNTPPSPSVIAPTASTPSPIQPQNDMFAPDNPQSQFSVGTFAQPAPAQSFGANGKTNLFSRLRSKKYFLPAAIAAGVLLLAGTATSAYFLVGSNSPEKTLANAVKKTLQQQNVTTKGSITGIKAGNQDKPLKIEVEAQQNSKDKKASLSTVIDLDGQKFTIDAKIVDKSIYIKLGDLNTLMKMFGLDMSNPAFKNYANAINGVNKSIGDQWIEIGEEFINQVNKDCSLDSLFVEMSKEDQDLLFKQYKENSFAKITGSKKDSVNGKAATQYSLDIDSEKINKYFSSLGGLSTFKKLQECQGNKGSKENTEKINELTKDNAKNEYDIWVDKSSGMISKMQIKSNEDGKEIVVQMDLDYGKADISTPENAKSIQSVVQEIMQIPEVAELLENLGASNGSPLAAQDTERQTDIRAIHGQLEAFAAQNGFYPSLANLNDLTWISTTFKGLDKEALKDPRGGQYKLVSTPSANNYAYAATPSGCNECEGYKLTAMLSDGSTYVKDNL